MGVILIQSTTWNTIPFCAHTVFCSSTSPLMDIHVASTLCLLWIMLLWIGARYLSFYFPFFKGEEWLALCLSHVRASCVLSFWPLHILTTPGYCLVFRLALSYWCKVEPLWGFVCLNSLVRGSVNLEWCYFSLFWIFVPRIFTHFHCNI